MDPRVVWGCLEWQTGVVVVVVMMVMAMMTMMTMMMMHWRIASQFQDCLSEGQVPEWMVLGRTVLVIKDPDKGNSAGSYCPITCLPLMWKLLIGIIAEELYEHLEQNGLL